ncbi:MAG: hypothetical protein GXZ11_06325 [Tissierellia bacterium]|nr:hypothetical protein [Tissierellia bacterium]
MNKKERLSDALERIGAGLAKAGDRIATETRLILEISRLRLKIKDDQYEFRKIMESIGNSYYKSDGNMDLDEYSVKKQKADELLDNIELLRKEVDDLMEEQKNPSNNSKREEDFEDDAYVPLSSGSDGPHVVVEDKSEKAPCPECGHLMSKSLAYCINCSSKL